MISAMGALPIVVNLTLHWPGELGKYLSYSSSTAAGGHSLSQDLHYVPWYWWPGGGWAAWLMPVWFHSPAAPHGATVIAALKRTDIIAGPVR